MSNSAVALWAASPDAALAAAAASAVEDIGVEKWDRGKGEGAQGEGEKEYMESQGRTWSEPRP